MLYRGYQGLRLGKSSNMIIFKFDLFYSKPHILWQLDHLLNQLPLAKLSLCKSLIHTVKKLLFVIGHFVNVALIEYTLPCCIKL